jgi:hypothetical protein
VEGPERVDAFCGAGQTAASTDPLVDIRIRWRLPRVSLGLEKGLGDPILFPTGSASAVQLRWCTTTLPAALHSTKAQCPRDGREHDVPEEAPGTTRAARARR